MQFLFANHTLDTERRELHYGSTPVAVEPQVFDLLIYLMQNRERVVSKDDLIASVWGGRIVSDSTLASRINAARRAIGDNGDEQRLIRTVARKGIRFVGAVSMRTQAAAFSPGPVLRPAAPAPEARARSERPGIAVLPFLNSGGESEQEYFSDGISEDIITALSRLRWVFVIARNASFAYRGKSIPMRQIGEELGVSYLLDGSVRKSGERVRITAQLSEVATGKQLWAERYERRLADVFAVQDEITEAIVAAIEPQVYAAESFRAQGKPPESLDAWDLVMRALSHFWRVTREDNRAAQHLLAQALAIDPSYGRALALLAVSHSFGVHMGWDDGATIAPIASEAGMAAVRADGEDPWAHVALACGYVHLGRLEDALAAFDSALRLNPSFAYAQGCYGLVLSYVGRGREGYEAAHRALRLSPNDPFAVIYHGIAAYAVFVEGDYQESIRLARTATRQRHDFVAGRRVLTGAAAMAGEMELARASLEELRRVQPNVSLAWMSSQIPFRGEHRDRFLEGLRRAGME